MQSSPPNSTKLGDRLRFFSPLGSITATKSFREKPRTCVGRTRYIYKLVYRANLIRSYQNQYISFLLITLATRWRKIVGFLLFGKKRRPQGKNMRLLTLRLQLSVDLYCGETLFALIKIFFSLTSLHLNAKHEFAHLNKVRNTYIQIYTLQIFTS